MLYEVEAVEEDIARSATWARPRRWGCCPPASGTWCVVVGQGLEHADDRPDR
jgi:hypothetical protein